MSKTTDALVCCPRCGNPSAAGVCGRCGYDKGAAYRCDFCGDAITRRIYETLRICIPCARAELEGMAYRYATLDANIKLLEGP